MEISNWEDLWHSSDFTALSSAADNVIILAIDYSISVEYIQWYDEAIRKSVQQLNRNLPNVVKCIVFGDNATDIFDSSDLEFMMQQVNRGATNPIPLFHNIGKYCLDLKRPCSLILLTDGEFNVEMESSDLPKIHTLVLKIFESDKYYGFVVDKLVPSIQKSCSSNHYRVTGSTLYCKPLTRINFADLYNHPLLTATPSALSDMELNSMKKSFLELAKQHSAGKSAEDVLKCQHVVRMLHGVKSNVEYGIIDNQKIHQLPIREIRNIVIKHLGNSDEWFIKVCNYLLNNKLSNLLLNITPNRDDILTQIDDIVKEDAPFVKEETTVQDTPEEGVVTLPIIKLPTSVSWRSFGQKIYFKVSHQLQNLMDRMTNEPQQHNKIKRKKRDQQEDEKERREETHNCYNHYHRVLEMPVLFETIIHEIQPIKTEEVSFKDVFYEVEYPTNGDFLYFYMPTSKALQTIIFEMEPIAAIDRLLDIICLALNQALFRQRTKFSPELKFVFSLAFLIKYDMILTKANNHVLYSFPLIETMLMKLPGEWFKFSVPHFKDLTLPNCLNVSLRWLAMDSTRTITWKEVVEKEDEYRTMSNDKMKRKRSPTHPAGSYFKHLHVDYFNWLFIHMWTVLNFDRLHYTEQPSVYSIVTKRFTHTVGHIPMEQRDRVQTLLNLIRTLNHQGKFSTHEYFIRKDLTFMLVEKKCDIFDKITQLEARITNANLYHLIDLVLNYEEAIPAIPAITTQFCQLSFKNVDFHNLKRHVGSLCCQTGRIAPLCRVSGSERSCCLEFTHEMVAGPPNDVQEVPMFEPDTLRTRGSLGFVFFHIKRYRCIPTISQLLLNCTNKSLNQIGPPREHNESMHHYYHEGLFKSHFPAQVYLPTQESADKMVNIILNLVRQKCDIPQIRKEFQQLALNEKKEIVQERQREDQEVYEAASILLSLKTRNNTVADHPRKRRNSTNDEEGGRKKIKKRSLATNVPPPMFSFTLIDENFIKIIDYTSKLYSSFSQVEELITFWQIMESRPVNCTCLAHFIT